MNEKHVIEGPCSSSRSRDIYLSMSLFGVNRSINRSYSPYPYEVEQESTCVHTRGYVIYTSDQIDIRVQYNIPGYDIAALVVIVNSSSAVIRSDF